MFLGWVSDAAVRAFRKAFAAGSPARGAALRPGPDEGPARGIGLLGLEGYDPLPALCLTASGRLEDVVSWLAADGVTCCLTGRGDALRRFRLSPAAGRWSMLLVDLDDLGGIAAVVDDLVAIRAAVPDLPVLLFTQETEADDLSRLRLALCDATLKLPVSQTRLDLALCEAQQNNAAWQARQTAAPGDRRPVEPLVLSRLTPAV